MTKKSFFERLTGSVKMENDKENILKGNAGGKKATSGKRQRIHKKVTDYAEDIGPSPRIITALTKKAENSKTKKMSKSILREKKKEFPEEAEGQLTIDVYQTDADILIKSTIAGVKPEDIDVSITNDMVTIRGAREKDERVKAEDYYYQECYWGSFSRSVILPVDVVAEKAEAAIKNGILTIKLPKAERIRTKKIQVKGL